MSSHSLLSPKLQCSACTEARLGVDSPGKAPFSGLVRRHPVDQEVAKGAGMFAIDCTRMNVLWTRLEIAVVASILGREEQLAEAQWLVQCTLLLGTARIFVPWQLTFLVRPLTLHSFDHECSTACIHCLYRKTATIGLLILIRPVVW
ncbi:uncharacterized protein UHOD_11589 [Ustilago sp. UG-2017b]|nr:uncharacterized protein UHOD_11589 [Ustilago sp. UG-2017b]